MPATRITERHVEVGGHTLRVRDAGDPEGRPLVYFHGTPSCRLEPAFADRPAAELGGELLDRPELASALAGSLRGAMAHGTSGAGWDNVAWVGPWDIDLGAIRRPVFLWYADEDTFAPPVHGEWLDEHLPTATFVIRGREGHMAVMEHAREILETLTAD